MLAVFRQRHCLHAAKVIDEAESMSAHGVSFGKPKINIDQLREWKDGIVNQLTGGLKSMAKQRKVQIITGMGEFMDPNHLCVTDADANKNTVHFENAIIAAGSLPVMLPFLPEDSRIIDSTGALELTEIPEHLLGNWRRYYRSGNGYCLSCSRFKNIHC